jgi:hypothetical protein
LISNSVFLFFFSPRIVTKTPFKQFCSFGPLDTATAYIQHTRASPMVPT